MTRKIHLPLPAFAGDSKIKRSSRLNRSGKTNVFILYVVLKTAPNFVRSLASSSKIQVKLMTFWNLQFNIWNILYITSHELFLAEMCKSFHILAFGLLNLVLIPNETKEVIQSARNNWTVSFFRRTSPTMRRSLFCNQIVWTFSRLFSILFGLKTKSKQKYIVGVYWI